MQTVEEKTILTPVEVSIAERYELGTIERVYRFQGIDLRQEKEDIAVFVEYRRESPARDSCGNREWFDRESVSFDSNATHRPFFSEGYSGVTNKTGQLIYGGRFVKITDHRENQVTRHHERGFQSKDRHGLDVSTWEQDVLELFRRLPENVRDVVGL